MKFKITNTHSSRADEYREWKSHGTVLTRTLISLAVMLVAGFLYYYLVLPPINIHSTATYGFVIFLCVAFMVPYMLLAGFGTIKNQPHQYVIKTVKTLKVPAIIIGLTIAVLLVGLLIGAELFRAKDYAALLQPETGDFAEDIDEISFDRIPMLDSDSANRLTDKKLGELADMVSQFEVNDTTTQINFNGTPVRVAYLDYGDFFKWLSNRKNGLPAYMVVDMVTQEVTVKRLSEGIKYSTSEHFGRDINRHLRFKYPTYIFDEINFEIDDNGVPYWVASVVDMEIGLFGGKDPKGAVLCNAQTGDCQYYDIKDVPTWVDRVISSDLVIEQYDYNGRYKNGFFNSIFGQKDCTETTDGYNYIALNDDVWMYTGITSLSGDRGNIGFILVNQRTKESRYYSCAGAEEFSAMSSAEGALQNYKYTATFPLLLNIEAQPTYFMALKDTAGLVKMYAMVNVQQYQIVATGSDLDKCYANYLKLLAENNIELPIPPASGNETLTGAIEDIRSAIIDGNTHYYIKVSGSDKYFDFTAKANQEIILWAIGDSVTVTYAYADTAIIAGISIVKNQANP